MGAYAWDIGVLAGYMLVFTGEMCNRYPLLNLHPALPGGPVGTWQEVIWQLIEARAEHTGAMMHLATEVLDQGPPATFFSFSLRGPVFDPLWAAVEGRSVRELREQEGEENALFQAIRRYEAARELPLVVETLKALADGRLRIEGQRVLDSAGRELPGGLDLTAEIEAAVAAISP